MQFIIALLLIFSCQQSFADYVNMTPYWPARNMWKTFSGADGTVYGYQQHYFRNSNESWLVDYDPQLNWLYTWNMKYDPNRGVLETADQFHDQAPLTFRSGGEIFWGHSLSTPVNNQVQYTCQSIVGTTNVNFGHQCVGIMALLPSHTFVVSGSARTYNSVIKLAVIQQTSKPVYAVYYFAPGVGFIQIDFHNSDWSLKGTWYLKNVVNN